MNGSYNASKIADDFNNEISRLKSQVDVFWPSEIKKYKEYGLLDHMNIAEFGSGPGYLTKKLIDYFKNITITAVDMNESLHLTAEKLLKPYASRVNWLTSRVESTQLPNNSFDAVIIRLVLEHAPCPTDILDEARRILKDGGKVLVIDNDFSMHLNSYPPVDGLSVLYDAYCRARLQEQGDPCIGKRLPKLLKSTGFIDISFDAICAHSTLIGDEAFRQSEGLGIAFQLVKDGFLTGKDLACLIKNWKKMIDHQDHVIIRQLFFSSGVKKSG